MKREHPPASPGSGVVILLHSFPFTVDIHLAVGLANGRVALRSFAASPSAAKELSPRSLRPCSGLSWSRLRPHNLLAAGFDRARGDGAVAVFDVEGTATRGTVLNTSVQTRYVR